MEDFKIIAIDSIGGGIIESDRIEELLNGKQAKRVKIEYKNGWSIYGLFDGKYKLHSYFDLPAVEIFNDDGGKQRIYYKEGILHRNGEKPADGIFDDRGRPRHIAFFSNGEERTGSKPSYISFRYTDDGYFVYSLHKYKNKRPGDIISCFMYKTGGKSFYISASIINENGEKIYIEFDENVSHISNPRLFDQRF